MYVLFNFIESGRFLAVDLGGTRCRVLLVDVHNNKTSAKVVKEDLPARCYTGSGVEVMFGCKHLVNM